MDEFEEVRQVVVFEFLPELLELGVRVDDLVPEGSGGQVGSLGDVEKFVNVGSVEVSGEDWP